MIKKKAQERNSKRISKLRSSKQAQEEMVGFALIIMLVSVIFLVFLGFSLRSGSKENVESYEVESFLQGALQYTSECEISGRGFRSIQRLVSDCYGDIEGGRMCLNGESSCEVLESSLIGLVESSWEAGEEFPVKRYELKIYQEDLEEAIFVIEGGGDSSQNYENSKGDGQPIPGDEDMEIFFKAYY